jgi:hypothetical protein
MKDWAPLIDGRTPFAALAPLAERFADDAIEELRELLARDFQMRPEEIDKAIAKLAPGIRQRTRAALESAWQDCVLHAASTH